VERHAAGVVGECHSPGEGGRHRAAHRVDNRRQDQIVLAYQRYGRGKAIAMPVQDTWMWRMDAKVAVTDTTHVMFWRRLIRWLVDGVPEQVNVTTTADRVEPGEPIKLSAEVSTPPTWRSTTAAWSPRSPHRRAGRRSCRSSGR